MGITERREREREALRTSILEAARDILSEQGLDALSMRAIAERIEYSPATIYLHFKDKDELIHCVVEEGFERMGAYMAEEIETCGAEATAVDHHFAMGLAYARFALENTAYFRVMFELPTCAQVECLTDPGHPMTGDVAFNQIVATVQRSMDAGAVRMPDAHRGAVIGWGLVHGITSLFLAGHLKDTVTTPGEFLDLVAEAMGVMHEGTRVPDGAGARKAPAGTPA
jgi:AcrR family transcriptional regulator